MLSAVKPLLNVKISSENTFMDVVFQELSTDEITALLGPFEDTETSQDAGCINSNVRDLQQVNVYESISDQKQMNTKSSTKRDVKMYRDGCMTTKRSPVPKKIFPLAISMIFWLRCL